MHLNEPYPGELAGFWRKIRKGFKKAIKPPKRIRKALRRAFTPPKWARKGLERAMTPPKWARKALMPPKAVRKTMEKNPWLADVVEGAIAIVAFLPIPGARVVSVALDALYQTSMAGWAIEDQKKYMKQVAREEAALIAEENAAFAWDARQGVIALDDNLRRADARQRGIFTRQVGVRRPFF